MKQQLFSKIIYVLILIGGLSACTPKAEKTEYTHAIPTDVREVAAFDLKGLVMKAGLNTDESKALQRQLAGILLEGSSDALQKEVDKYLDAPAETGVEWNAPLYLFEAPSLRCPAVVLKIADLEKFDSMLATLAGDGICSTPQQADGYRYTDLQGIGVQLAYNDGTLLGIYGGSSEQLKKLQPAIAALMKQPADKSIRANAHYAAMMKQKGDVRLLATPDALPFEVRGVLHWPTGTPLTGYVLFENGRIYATLQRADFDGETCEDNQPVHPQNARELQQAMSGMMRGNPFNISLTSDELMTLTNLRALMEFAADTPEVNTLYQLIMKVEELNLRGDTNRTNFTVVLNKQNENALKQLVDFARQFLSF